jgi:hypothetical protein
MKTWVLPSRVPGRSFSGRLEYLMSTFTCSSVGGP